jgi:hypothetical protein
MAPFSQTNVSRLDRPRSKRLRDEQDLASEERSTVAQQEGDRNCALRHFE